jgi:photosystem II stability/assembly factor-like uncharacterized protein
VEESLAGVSFTNALHGVVVGYSASILATTDGGAHWTPLPAPDGVGFRDVAFIDELHGTVIGYDGAIFGTRDGGQTWTDHSINTLADMRAVAFSGDTGVIVGEFGYILLSFDGGRHSWIRMSRGVL